MEGMTRRRQIWMTVWTSLSLVPVLLLLFGWSMMECSDADPCPTGGKMPFGEAAAIFGVMLMIGQGIFLKSIWRGR